MREFDRQDVELGKWNVICDRCGFKYKNDKLRIEWTGLMTCHGEDTNNCWEPKPFVTPQSRVERPRIPYVSVMNDQFVDKFPACPIWGVRAYAGLAVVGCAIAGLDDIPPEVLAQMKTGAGF